MHIAQRDSPIKAFSEFRLDCSPILIHIERCGKYHDCHNEDEGDDPDYDSYFAYTTSNVGSRGTFLPRPNH